MTPRPTPPTSLAEIKARLRSAIAGFARAGERSGYFAASYLDTTTRVEAGLEQGTFEDPSRVAALTVAYAERYLRTLDDFRAGRSIARCWQLSLATDRARRLTILQHLLLAMNAHINYDLGIAIADLHEREGSRDLARFHRDFLRINGILEHTLDDFQDRIDRCSPVMAAVDWLGWRLDERTFNFSVARARDAAWALASNQIALRASGNAEAAEHALHVLDRSLTWLGRLISDPGPLLGVGSRAILAFESDDVAAFLADLPLTADCVVATA